MSLSDRLRLAMDHSGVKQAQLARGCGVAPPSVHGWLSGKSKFLRGENLLRAAQVLGVNQQWLATGDGPMLASVGQAQTIGVATKFGTPSATAGLPGAFETNPNTAKTVWVIGKGQGGMPERIWSDGDHPVGITDEYAEVHSADPHAFLVRIEGSSMWPKFEDGNYVLVEPGTEPELEDCVLVRLETGQTLIKRLLSRRHGYKLGSFNDPQILEYPRDQVTWCYYIAHEVPRRKIKSRH